MEYQLVLSHRRKTIGLQVSKGQIIVRAPNFLTRPQIDALVQKKSTWLKAKLLEQRQSEHSYSEVLNNGATLCIGGVFKTLTVSFAAQMKIDNLSEKIVVTLPLKFRLLGDEKLIEQQIKKQLALWFKQQAEFYISMRMPELTKQTQLTPELITVKKYKARWGSCNNRAQLSFSYLLVMVPDWVFDYVIVHELCHLKYLNHSPQFWQLVALYQPNYKIAMQWLKKHQSQLSW